MSIQLPSIAPALKLAEDGIWYGATDAAISYPADANELCAGIEQASFWFRHRNDCILAAVQAFPPSGTLLDIGGGNGHAAFLTANGYDVAVMEPGRTGASNAKRRGIETVICASLGTAQFVADSLPAAGLFDVLEHIEDDLEFLGDLRTALSPSGRFYLTVPAYQALWSTEDDKAGHFRRYTISRLRDVLGRAGFSIDFASYFFRCLPVPIALLRALPHRLGLSRSETTSEGVARQHGVGRPMAARLLTLLTLGESDRIRRGAPMLIGGSCIVVAHRG